MKELLIGFVTGLGIVCMVEMIDPVIFAQRQPPLTRQPLSATNEATLDALGKMNQEVILPAVRRCLEQELTPVYAVNPEQIVAQHTRLTAEAFKIIVCVEAK
jgi:hypothetical protein